MVRPLEVAVLLLSIHPLLNQFLPHLHPTHRTDLLTYLPQALASDSLANGWRGGVPLCWFPW